MNFHFLFFIIFDLISKYQPSFAAYERKERKKERKKEVRKKEANRISVKTNLNQVEPKNVNPKCNIETKWTTVKEAPPPSLSSRPAYRLRRRRRRRCCRCCCCCWNLN